MKRALTALTAVVMISALAAPLAAQSPRMSLVEEATNASCGPCAAQNPFFEAFLARPYCVSRAIPIVYHANWPGADVMNAANKTVHNTRVSYYGITGVPTAVVNGIIPTPSGSGYAGAPSDTVALSRDIDKAVGMSPITITVSEVVNGDQVTVTVEVQSTTALASKKLRIAAVEGEHYYTSAGTNGEKDFFYIVRDMLPNAAGTDLTLAANEKKTFTNTFTYNSEWNKDAMYVVAFVQDDASKEVLQAGMDKLAFTLTTTGGSAKMNDAADAPMEFASLLTTPVAGTYQIEIASTVPTGWTSDVLYNGTALQSGATITIEANTPTQLKVRMTPTATKYRRGDVTFTVKGPRGGLASQQYRLYSRNLDAAVLVRDEGNSQIALYWQRAFDRCATNYAFVAPGDENVLGLDDFRVLVCEVGKSVFVKADVDYLTRFIDHGGRLFLSGAEIGWGLADPASDTLGVYTNRDFLKYYLHADYVADNAGQTTVKGVTGDPVTDGISTSFTGGVQNQDTPDQIAPRAGAVTCLTYGSNANAVAGIRYADGKNRLVFLGFGLEGIASNVTRGTILDKGIQWLLGTDVTGVEDAHGAPVARIADVYPNPASRTLAVPVTLDTPGRVTIALYDMTGRMRLQTSEMAATGALTRTLDVSALPAGAYMLHVTAGAQRTSRLVSIAR